MNKKNIFRFIKYQIKAKENDLEEISAEKKATTEEIEIFV
jgi:hypothetical protein